MKYLIATSRSWNEILSQRLEEHTGHEFHLITNKKQLTSGFLGQVQPRYIFFPHWSHMVPENIFSRYECVIFHMTDLPYGRGGSPLQNLIQRGHKDTKISALRCEKQMDAGPVYLKRPLSLEGSASEIFLRASKIIEEMILEMIQCEPAPVPQKGEPVCFERRTPAQSDLNNAQISNLNDFFDFVRMLDAQGYPKAFINVHEHRMELSRIQMEADMLVGTFKIYKRTGPKGKQ